MRRRASEPTQIGHPIREISNRFRAIPTQYAGIEFCSRLEARWAVYLDALKVPWYYEYEGFEFESGEKYLPDFFLPQVNCWLEIKPESRPRDEEEMKCGKLAEATSKRVFLACGAPTAPEDDLGGLIRYGYDADPNGAGVIWSDEPYFFCSCPVCGRIGAEFDGRGLRVCSETHGEPGGRGHTGDRDDFLIARMKARTARFW